MFLKKAAILKMTGALVFIERSGSAVIVVVGGGECRDSQKLKSSAEYNKRVFHRTLDTFKPPLPLRHKWMDGFGV